MSFSATVNTRTSQPSSAKPWAKFTARCPPIAELGGKWYAMNRISGRIGERRFDRHTERAPRDGVRRGRPGCEDEVDRVAVDVERPFPASGDDRSAGAGHHPV